MGMTCGKCGGGMMVGFIIDHGSYARLPDRWNAGEPRIKKWFGLRENRKAQLDIATWRCDRCGFLESYAADPDGKMDRYRTNSRIE